MPGWRRRGVALTGALVTAIMLSACAGDDSPAGPESPSPSGSGPLVVEIVIDNLQVSPTLDRVPVDIGDEISLRVTSDTDDTIHVHGVDRQLVLTAGEQCVLDFTIPPGLPRGLYTVEAHSGGLILFELRVR